MNDSLANFAMAGTSMAVAKTVGGPLELWRVQRQQSFIPNSTLKGVLKKESIRHLWKGNGVNIIKGVPQYALNYAIFKTINEEIENKYISGILSGAISMGFIYPLETTKTYLSLQTNKNKYKGIYDCLKLTPNRNLYRGISMGLLEAGAFSGLLFPFQSILSEKYPQLSPISGGLASIGALCITYPIDLMKRRLQLQNFDKSVPIYRNNRDIIKKIKMQEGVRGFYKGIHANFVKSFFQWSIHFHVLEYLNKLIKK